jgi:hypothetical protein
MAIAPIPLCGAFGTLRAGAAKCLAPFNKKNVTSQRCQAAPEVATPCPKRKGRNRHPLRRRCERGLQERPWRMAGFFEGVEGVSLCRGCSKQKLLVGGLISAVEVVIQPCTDHRKVFVFFQYKRLVTRNEMPIV